MCLSWQWYVAVTCDWQSACLRGSYMWLARMEWWMPWKIMASWIDDVGSTVVYSVAAACTTAIRRVMRTLCVAQQTDGETDREMSSGDAVDGLQAAAAQVNAVDDESSSSAYGGAVQDGFVLSPVIASDSSSDSEYTAADDPNRRLVPRSRPPAPPAAVNSSDDCRSLSADDHPPTAARTATSVPHTLSSFIVIIISSSSSSRTWLSHVL